MLFSEQSNHYNAWQIGQKEDSSPTKIGRAIEKRLAAHRAPSVFSQPMFLFSLAVITVRA
jgi:hypothetical protein